MSPYTPEAFAMAKRIWTFSEEDPDINKKITYLEKSREYSNYIPNLIHLSKYYSIRAKINQLRNYPEKEYINEKQRAEIIFNYTLNEIGEQNNRIANKRGTFYQRNIHNHHLFFEWGEHCLRWQEFKFGIECFGQAIKEIKEYGDWTYESDEKTSITATIFIARCYLELKDFSSAQFFLDDVEKNKNPYHPYLHTIRGELSMAMSQSPGISDREKDEYLQKSASYFNKAIIISSDNYYPNWCLARLYLIRGEQKKALEQLKEAQKKADYGGNMINQLKIGIELIELEKTTRL